MFSFASEVLPLALGRYNRSSAGLLGRTSVLLQQQSQKATVWQATYLPSHLFAAYIYSMLYLWALGFVATLLPFQYKIAEEILYWKGLMVFAPSLSFPPSMFPSMDTLFPLFFSCLPPYLTQPRSLSSSTTINNSPPPNPSIPAASGVGCCPGFGRWFSN